MLRKKGKTKRPEKRNRCFGTFLISLLGDN